MFATSQNLAPTLLVFPTSSTFTDASQPAVQVDGETFVVVAALIFTGDPVALTPPQDAATVGPKVVLRTIWAH